MTNEEMLKWEITQMQKQIHDLQLRVKDLSEENIELQRRSKLLDDLVYDKLMKKSIHSTI